MDLSRETQKRKEFCDILFELANSQDILQDARIRSDMYRRLEFLYDAEPTEKPFRHFYSDIFYVLTQVQQNSELGDVNILGQNIDVIRNGYNPQNWTKDGSRIIDITDSINKLYDHVNLDIARILYSDAADRKISGEAALKDLQTQINSMHIEAQKIADNLDITDMKISKMEDKLADSQKEYIAILAIFAAVVLAFTGGIAFSTSVLNNIAQVSAYRTIIVALIIGLVLVNVLFGLFYYVNTLVDKGQKICPLIISNAIIVVLLVVTVVAWSLGWVERRDKNISNKLSTQADKFEKESDEVMPVDMSLS